MARNTGDKSNAGNAANMLKGDDNWGEGNAVMRLLRKREAEYNASKSKAKAPAATKAPAPKPKPKAPAATNQLRPLKTDVNVRGAAATDGQLSVANRGTARTGMVQRPAEKARSAVERPPLTEVSSRQAQARNGRMGPGRPMAGPNRGAAPVRPTGVGRMGPGKK